MKDNFQELSTRQFRQRLKEAGWSKKDIDKELERIQEDDEDGDDYPPFPSDFKWHL